MIDLHSHLPGAECEDDLAASLDVCRRAVEDGVRMIVLTPRWAEREEEPPLDLVECVRRLEQLRDGLNQSLSFKAGFLMAYRAELPDLLERYGSSISLGGGRYVFVSLPALNVPAEAETVWKRIADRGYSVLVARAECNRALRRDSERLERWIAAGVRLQLDAASLTGLHGHEIQSFAIRCVKKYEGSVVVASGVGSARARLSTLALARTELLKRNESRRSLHKLLFETPAAMLCEDGNIAGALDNGRAFRLPLVLRRRALSANSRPLPDES